MGTGEEGTPTKPAKPTSTTQQEQPATPTTYPDWAAAFQAYYGPGATPPPPAFFPSTVGSAPTPHPYMWGGQPLMPPYGTPLPYPAMYPHGGIYAHPSMPPGALPYGHYGMPSPSNAEVTTTAALPSAETEAKTSDGKDRNTMKRSKGSLGSLGMITGKGEGGKATSGSANDAVSQSGESGSEGSSEGSEEDNTQNESQIGRKRSFDQMIVDGASAQSANMSAYSAQVGEAYLNASGHAVGNPVNQTVAVPLGPVTGKPAISGPITNLNIGMDVWNPNASGAITAVKGRCGTTGLPSALVPATAQLMPSGRDGVPPELWIQDERELKRQRRKQSNRESARRSRLRKQAECEELASKVDHLTAENMQLRNELNCMTDECKKLTAENASIMEQLSKLHGEDAAVAAEENGPAKLGLQAIKPEGNGHFHDITRASNSNASQRNEQRQSEPCESNGKVHTLLDANTRSDTG